ncbi:MAG: hypothetical protein ACLPWF_13680 [Bryobacteraceae bacterium]
MVPNAAFGPITQYSNAGVASYNGLTVGPHFFDADLSLMKSIRFKERLTFSFGAQAYNFLNHPNFDQPEADISNPNFGRIVANVAPPTSILGAFVAGGAASPRFVELKGVLRF